MNSEKPTGIELIAAERARQISVEAWTPEHDDAHIDGSIASAAAAYAVQSTIPPIQERQSKTRTLYLEKVVRDLWPWDWEWWKPKTPMKDLVRAGALIAAELDRRMRAGETLE